MDAVSCVGCGYDLSGLSARGKCPECGVGIGVSLRAALLAGPTKYLSRIYGAMWLLAAGFIVTLAGGCVALGGSALVSAPVVFYEYCMVVMCVGASISCGGFWLLGWPRGAEAAGLGQQGLVLRIHAAVLLSLSLALAQLLVLNGLGATGVLFAAIVWGALLLNAWVLTLMFVWMMLVVGRTKAFAMFKRYVGAGALIAATVLVVPVTFWGVFAEDRVGVRVVAWVPSTFAAMIMLAGVVPVGLFTILGMRVGTVLRTRRLARG